MNSDKDNNNYDVMGFDDGMSMEKPKNGLKAMKRLFQALSPQKWKITVAFIFAIVGVLFTLYAPLIFANVINVIFEGVTPFIMGLGNIEIDFNRLANYTLLLIGIYILSFIFMFFQEQIMANVGQKLVLVLREQVSQKLARVPLKYFDSHKRGEILSRVVNDLEKVNEIVKDAIMRMFTSFVTITGAIILMARISGVLTLIAIGAIFVGLVVTVIVSIKAKDIFMSRQTSLGIFNSRIEEYFSGQVEIKTFTLEKEVNAKADEAIEQLYKDDKKAQFIIYAIMPIIRLFNQIGYVIIAGVGAMRVINGQISVGQIMSFFQYVQMSAEPLVEGSQVYSSLQSAIASAERVFEVLDEVEDEADSKAAIKLEKPQGNISFENVVFGYGDEPLMDGVSFDVKAGQKVAIVGQTGAGKTTLVNLIMRFYEVQGGAIKIDGVNIRDFERHYLRSLFGMVLQDSWIFDGTVIYNVAYGRNTATKKEVINAAKAARADYFIRTLPQGYETLMNDENASLSQGEKQLLCIARAILAEPHFLLLDEATSSVDTRTELHIQKAMDNLMKGRTSFIIAHRLSTIKNAYVILVMDNGTIVEMGSHLDLLAKGGMYSDIYNSQFAS
jgi:ATP-binding cassette subfamily B protein